MGQGGGILHPVSGPPGPWSGQLNREGRSLGGALLLQGRRGPSLGDALEIPAPCPVQEVSPGLSVTGRPPLLHTLSPEVARILRYFPTHCGKMKPTGDGMCPKSPVN